MSTWDPADCNLFIHIPARFVRDTRINGLCNRPWTGNRRVPLPRGVVADGFGSIVGRIFNWSQLGDRDRSDTEIQPNYLVEETTRRLLLIGAIMASESMAPFLVCDSMPKWDCQDDDEWLDHVQSRCGTGYHTVGSCHKGSVNERNAMVDDALRIHGS